MGTLIALPKRLIPKRVYGKFRVFTSDLPDGSNPTEAEVELSLTSVDTGRNLLCRRQTQCVTFAAAAGWEGYVCSSCSVIDKMSREEYQADLDGLAELLRALNLFHSPVDNL